MTDDNDRTITLLMSKVGMLERSVMELRSVALMGYGALSAAGYQVVADRMAAVLFPEPPSSAPIFDPTWDTEYVK